MNYTLSEDVIRSVVNTLRIIDARGYNSMAALVSLVNFFESILNLPKPKGGEENAVNNTVEP